MSSSKLKLKFNDAEKAKEALILLEKYDIKYQKDRINGLLRCAKHRLAITKDAVKAQNITGAIQIFEKWLAENCDENETNTYEEYLVDVVPGLGYKDKATAQETLRILAERDPMYIKQTLTALVTNSKRVLRKTKNKEKIAAIQEGVQVLEEFLEKFDTESRIKDNRPYITYELISKFPAPENPLVIEFLSAYGGPKARQNYKRLRTMFPKNDSTTSWDIVRNREIIKLLEKPNSDEDEATSWEGKLFDDKTGAPTPQHLDFIHWAYSPQIRKLLEYTDNLDKESSDDEATVPQKKLKSL